MTGDLPDVLRMQDGAAVRSADQWPARKAELRGLFERHMYGVRPDTPAESHHEVRYENTRAFDGLATVREVALHLRAPSIELRLLHVLPNESSSPPPTFLGLNFDGNHTLLGDPGITRPAGWTDDGRARFGHRGSQAESWDIERSVRLGFAVCSLYNGDVVPDAADLAEPALDRLVMTPAPAGARTATIMAWAWGLMRAMDYLHSPRCVPAPGPVTVVGHSRNGKAALLAGALDERFAAVIPSQSGCGGAGPSRIVAGTPTAPGGHVQRETVPIITERFPHWFCERFKRYGRDVERLPIDQHELIAMCAPRPVLLSNAQDDLWADPHGQYTALQAAAPVYELLTGEEVSASLTRARPSSGHGRLAFFMRAGGHAMTPADWSAWRQFTDDWRRVTWHAGPL